MENQALPDGHLARGVQTCEKSKTIEVLFHPNWVCLKIGDLKIPWSIIISPFKWIEGNSFILDRPAWFIPWIVICHGIAKFVDIFEHTQVPS